MTSKDNTSASDDVVRFASTPPAAGLPEWYPMLLISVSDSISQGQRQAALAANQELINTYWYIGRDILDRQSQQGWGTKFIDRLSAGIRERYPDIKRFMPINLKYERTLVGVWAAEAIVQAPLAQLPRYHDVALLEKLNEESTRTRCAHEALAEGWSRNHLVRHIETRLYERKGQATSNFNTVLPSSTLSTVQESTKDSYVFDFLELTESHNERELEGQLLQHIERFLQALGRGFAFVGQQLHLDVAGAELFPDLVLYNFILRRFVVVELKLSRFEPGHLGQLGMYLSVVDDLLGSRGMNQQSVCCCVKRRTLWLPNMRCTASALLLAWRSGQPRSRIHFRKRFPTACQASANWKRNSQSPISPRLTIPNENRKSQTR